MSALRGRLASLCGLDDLSPPSGPPRVLDEVRCDGYTRQLVTYETAPPANPARAFLLIPQGEGGPYPGVVVWHQHNSERHLGKSEVAGLAGDPLHAFGPALARAGFVVLAPDSRHFEDRRSHGGGTEPHDHDWLDHYNGLTYAIVRGDSLARQVLDDCLRATTALRHHPLVTDQIGVCGHSYGGNTALLHAALDERIRWCASSGALCSYRHKMARGTGLEMALVIPGVTNHVDMDRILELLAPRPLLVLSASDDPYSADAPELVNAARGSWPDGALVHLHWDGEHALTLERRDALLSWIRGLAGVGGGS